MLFLTSLEEGAEFLPLKCVVVEGVVVEGVVFALLGGRTYTPCVGVESKMGVRLEGERGGAGPSASLPNADTTYL